jgi:hypothetical protein
MDSMQPVSRMSTTTSDPAGQTNSSTTQKTRSTTWPWLVGLLLVATLTALATAWFTTRGRGRDREPRPLATFIHATDPHLYLEQKASEGDTGRIRREAQERMDRAALRELLSTAGNLPADEQPEFILFTGDWGIGEPAPPIPNTTQTGTAQRTGTTGQTETTGPTGTTEQTGTPGPTGTTTGTDSAAAAANPAAGTLPASSRWAVDADSLAVMLNTSPVKRIYWVPGNNDIRGERGAVDSLTQADQFGALVAQRLRNGVTMQNLTACFTGAGSCSVDVDSTRYTVLGIPTVSFKNKKRLADDSVAQAAIMARAEALVAAEAARGRRVLLATHIPEIDDPFVRGQQLYAAAPPSRSWLAASAWNVSDSVFAGWKRTVESPAVAAVLAGHFHDSHREVYERPYAWAESSALRADPSKLLLAPPLSVKNQDTSPIQARGFALIRLYADSVDRRMYWMDAAGHFVEAARPVAARSRRGGGAEDDDDPAALRPRWLWHVGDTLGNPGQMAIFLLGILIAFLTVAALWEVPEPRPSTRAAAPAAADTVVAASSPGAIFASNLGRTVLGGLTGVAGVALLQDVLGTGGGSGAKAFFLSVFITYFFWFLVVSALLRGFTAGLQARVTTPPRSVQLTGVAQPGLRRFRRWLQGFYRPLLVGVDTAANVLFGRGLRQAEIWETRFSDMQASLVRTIDITRRDLSRTVGAALNRARYRGVQPGTDYRVNVSLLGESAPETFYVSAEGGSLDRVFGAASLAFVSIHSGEARWWKIDYMPGRTRLRSRARLRTRSDDAPGLDTPLAQLFAVNREREAGPIDGPTVALYGTHASEGAASQSGEARTVQELLRLLNSPGWLGGGTNPSVASIDRDGYVVVQATADAGSLAIRSLKLGQIELGPFAGNPQRVLLYRNVPAIFADAHEEMFLDAYFEARSNPDYEAFMVIPIPPRQRVGGSSQRRGGIHISFRLAGYLDALWPALDQVSNDTRIPDYDLHNRLLEPAVLPDPELRAALALGTEVLGEAIQQLNDVWLRDHERHP